MASFQKFTRPWGQKDLVIEVGKYANAADGSCAVQYGDTVVLVAATMSKEGPREGMNFFPLMVEYEEKMYAAGRIKGSRFIKKEGRPTDEAILTARFIDRAVRPLFDPRLRQDVQIVATVLAFDGENDPDILALIGASCALTISDIPWDGPLAASRMGYVGETFVLNPVYDQRNRATLDLAVAGTTERVLMMEAGAKEAEEALVFSGIQKGAAALNVPLELIEEVRRAVGKSKRNLLSPKTPADQEKEQTRQRLVGLLRPFVQTRAAEKFFASPQATKADRAAAKNDLKVAVTEFLSSQGFSPEEVEFGERLVEDLLGEEVTRQILEHERRVDGRGLHDLRPIRCEVAAFSRLHGSGHFERGETQVLATVTLGAPGDEQTLDGMELTGTRRFMLHYNFPPYAVGEVKPMRGPGRREIGHGALAEKALEAMIPSKEDFPYTIRVVSEVLCSNGSSSMASVCGGSLALMDAGVPIKAPVAGVAMGLASLDKTRRWKILTDLQDLEDGEGGMDFKIAGTRDGITAIQLDTKTIGLTSDMIQETLKRGREARLRILDFMAQAIEKPRPELSPYAPRITSILIAVDKIREVIGPGGKIINEIIAKTGVTSIDIEENGLVFITSQKADGAQKAEDWIRMIVAEPEVGTIYTGTVTRLMDFGAFVEVLPKKEGLVHISEMAPYRVEKVSDIVKTGDRVQVKLFEVDDMGRLNLSMKQAPGNVYPPAPPLSANGNSGDHQGHRGHTSRPSRPGGHHGGGGRPPHQRRP